MATTSRSRKAQADQVPADYSARQTLKGAERFITPELKAFEDKVLSARERALAREKALYEELLEKLNADLPALQATAAALAEVDVLSASRRTGGGAESLPPRPHRTAGHRRFGRVVIRWSSRSWKIRSCPTTFA